MSSGRVPAATASRALQTLAQDLTAFNLEHYRKLQGELTLDDLRTFAEAGILRLGGTFIPEGDFYRIETPQALRAYRNVAARYDTACFRRDVAMRRKNADFMGIGHPLVDALIAHFQRSSWPGEVAVLKASEIGGGVSVRYVLEAQMEDGSSRRKYESVQIDSDGAWQARTARNDVELLAATRASPSAAVLSSSAGIPKARVEGAIADSEADFRAGLSGVQSVRGRLVGVAVVTT